MRKMKLEVLKRALEDAQRREIEDFSIQTHDGCIFKIKEITVSNITGMIIRLKKYY